MICPLLLGLGCAPSNEPPMSSRDPYVKIPAMKRATESRDSAAMKQLVADLDHDDPAVRLYAIQALDRMTGQRLGYNYSDEPETRKASIKRWQQWLEHGETPAAIPAQHASGDGSLSQGGADGR
jgi:hypothetical protein